MKSLFLGKCIIHVLLLDEVKGFVFPKHLHDIQVRTNLSSLYLHK